MIPENSCSRTAGQALRSIASWHLPLGTLLYKRDKDHNPLMRNTIFWVSPREAARAGGIFEPLDTTQGEHL